MRIDRASRYIASAPGRIYQALTSRDAVESWLPPAGARATVRAFDPRPLGAFCLTLTFDTPGEGGARKSSSTSDVVDGTFLELVPGELVRQRFTFRSQDPAFAGEMTMTWTLTPRGNGTEVAVTAENVPPGIDPQDHEVGMVSSLANLASYLE